VVVVVERLSDLNDLNEHFFQNALTTVFYVGWMDGCSLNTRGECRGVIEGGSDGSNLDD